MYVILHYMCFSDQLKRNYNLGQFYLEVELEDLSSFDESLAEKLYKLPSEHLPLVCRRITLTQSHRSHDN